MKSCQHCSEDGCSHYKPRELPEEVLKVTFLDSREVEPNEEKYPHYPLADSEIFHETNVINAKKLTYGENVKEGREYEPGDTIAIIPQNRDGDITKLFKHLKITDLAYECCRIIQKNADVKLKLKPVFLDEITTLYSVFKNFIDIQCIPKKSLINVMAEYTEDKNEKVTLKELCSKEGAKKYEDEILDNNKTFLDLIQCFQSCCPPVARLLENLPQLQPRPYSIASSPLSCNNSLKIVFTVAQSVMNGIMREGICTGMLKSIIHERNCADVKNMQIKMFFRKTGGFQLPKDDNHPLILIGPGSGIAPFMGFLEHRRMLKSKGAIWLFYGCRYKSNDYLFKSELENYLNCGTLSKLIVSFSREPGQNNRYVQDNLKNYGKEICDMIFHKKALIYVCGDAKDLRKDVMNALISIVEKYTGSTSKEATNFIKTLQNEKRYLQDVWL